MILPRVRDPRFVTIRRGGTLTDPDHHALARWAAACAEHVLDLFESARPEDPRPRSAIEHARAWARGEVRMMQARAAGGHAMGAARDLRGAARHAAYAAGQAAVVAHVAAHDLGAAAYAVKAARAAVPADRADAAGRRECRWQRDQSAGGRARPGPGRPRAAQRPLLVGLHLLTPRPGQRREPPRVTGPTFRYADVPFLVPTGLGCFWIRNSSVSKYGGNAR